MQAAALTAVANVYETIDELSVKKILMPKLKKVFKANQSDLKITASVLYCIEVLLDKMEKTQVRENCAPVGTGVNWHPAPPRLICVLTVDDDDATTTG